ncbi:hypothetical protein ET445_06550 [Agromyces protaetiae]|uniref:Uncharacterized protein n=1 Tax=Agromyces protaetiae TaxID=2509455 RepID=A0A4P6FRA0_9MICO|nr:hypothetical protein [Agromyces protaetiae]QAY73058.1 hypothetical protein ET445_06550 [Agromyces protaetiae]
MSEPEQPEQPGRERAVAEPVRILDELRRDDAAPPRGGRVALVLAVTGLAIAVGSGAVLAASAAGSIAEVGLAASESQEQDAAAAAVPSVTASPVAAAPAEASEPSPLPTAQPSDPADPVNTALIAQFGTSRFEYADDGTFVPLYDATTDLAAIPRDADQDPSEAANAEEWLSTQGITADCMADKGFDYTFTPFWLATVEYLTTPRPAASPEWREALDGAPDRGLGADYDWSEAGCWGYAVHVMGNDDAH